MKIHHNLTNPAMFVWFCIFYSLSQFQFVLGYVFVFFWGYFSLCYCDIDCHYQCNGLPGKNDVLRVGRCHSVSKLGE